MIKTLEFNALFLTAWLIAPDSANAFGVCVDWHPSAPRCSGSASSSGSGGGSTWVRAAPIKTPRDYARDAFNLAATYWRTGRYDLVLQKAREAIAHDSSYSLPYDLIAGVYFKREEYQTAVEFMVAALAREGLERYRHNLSAVLGNWAWTALQERDFRTAEQAARSILSYGLNDVQAYRILGRIRELQGDLNAAIDFYDRSRPSDAKRLRERIARQRREAARRRHEAMIAGLRSSANAALRDGRYAAAIRSLRGLLDHLPNNSDAWYSLGRALAGAGRLDAAARAYRKVGKLGAGTKWAEDAVFRLYWKDAEKRARNAGEAAKVGIWQSIVRRYPGERGNHARWRIISTLGNNNGLSEMAPIAMDILRAAPNDPNAPKLLGQIKQRIVRNAAKTAENSGDTDRAAAYMEALVRADPAATGASGDLAFYLVRQGNAERAIEVATAALEHAPKSANAHVMAAFAYRASNDLEKARFHAKKANDLSGGRYKDYLEEISGPISSVVGVVGTVFKPVRSAAGSVYRRGKVVAKDWGSTVNTLVGRVFADRASKETARQSFEAARSARYFGTMAVTERGMEASRAQSGLVFDTGAMIPGGASDGAATVLGTVSVEAGLPPIEETVPDEVRRTPEWRAMEGEKKALKRRARRVSRKIETLKRRYDRSPEPEIQQTLAVEIAQSKQQESEIQSQVAQKTFEQREFAFHFDTTIKPVESTPGSGKAGEPASRGGT